MVLRCGGGSPRHVQCWRVVVCGGWLTGVLVVVVLVVVVGASGLW